MYLKPFLKRLMLTGVLTSMCFVAFAQEAFLVVDILPLKEGKTLQDAQNYFDKVEPIFKRYQFERAQAPLKVVAIPRGDIEAQVINLWATPNPDRAFKGIFSDSDYEEYIEERNTIFQMSKATVIVTKQ